VHTPLSAEPACPGHCEQLYFFSLAVFSTVPYIPMSSLPSMWLVLKDTVIKYLFGSLAIFAF